MEQRLCQWIWDGTWLLFGSSATGGSTGTSSGAPDVGGGQGATCSTTDNQSMYFVLRGSFTSDDPGGETAILRLALWRGGTGQHAAGQQAAGLPGRTGAWYVKACQCRRGVEEAAGSGRGGLGDQTAMPSRKFLVRSWRGPGPGRGGTHRSHANGKVFWFAVGRAFVA